MRHTCDEFSETEWAAFWRSNERQIMTEHESVFSKTIRVHPWNDHTARLLPSLLETAPAGECAVQVLEGGRRSREPVELGELPRAHWMARAVRILAGDCWGPSPCWGVPPVEPALQLAR